MCILVSVSEDGLELEIRFGFMLLSYELLHLTIGNFVNLGDYKDNMS